MTPSCLGLPSLPVLGFSALCSVFFLVFML